MKENAKILSEQEVLEVLKGDDSPMAEMNAAIEFVKSAPDGGMVPAQKPYNINRDDKFIENWYVGATRSKIIKNHRCLKYKSGYCWDNLEDAREAIYVGKKAGYSDADIAAFLKRNYMLKGINDQN